jgi:cytochrome c-type biogenesis protein CcmH/NrfG
MRLTTLAVTCGLALAAASAQAQTSGTYTTGTGYSAEVTFSPGNMRMKEQTGKESEYRSIRQGEYTYTNPTNNIRYGMRVIDASTIEATKLDSQGNLLPGGTRLTLAGKAVTQPVSQSEFDKMSTIAQGYLQRAQTDPNNAQAWSFCGMAAMARAQGGNDAQVLQAATALKSFATTSSTPCPDAITPAVWSRAQ